MTADTILRDGLIWAGPATASATSTPTAIALSGDRVLAVGSDSEIDRLAASDCYVVDLQGRRVVPGLIDGHIHAVRAGTCWDRELHWGALSDIGSALNSVAAGAQAIEPGEWIRAVGGWHHTQFAERRPPTRKELDAIAGDVPVYLQALYEYALLNTAALRASGIDQLTADPPGGTIERDELGRPTGRITGLGAFNLCLAAMPLRSPEQERASIAAMTRALHARGLTGVVDAGGFSMDPRRYDSLFDLWRRSELTLRMRLFLSAVDPGHEVTQLNDWLTHGQSRFGDAILKVLGIGEVVHFGCHDFEGLEPFEMTDTAVADLETISRATARRGWPMQVHAVLDSSIDHILDGWETVNAEYPLADLRFTIAHVDRISGRNIARLRALGGGVVLDDHLVLKAEASHQVWGPDVIEHAPPVGDLAAAGVPIAAGTDATRASTFNPWLSLWWLVTGRSVDGVTRRSAAHRLSREQALNAYTSGSAWMSFEEHERGHLRPGALADLAVLDRDYFTIDEDEIPRITADLTIVGGRIVHPPELSAGPAPQDSPTRTSAAGP